MNSSNSVRVWDIPTRLFHWLLVALFGISWWSAENDAMDWHRLSGSALLGLIVFRLAWGFAGSNTARFASFVRSPMQVLAYIRSSDPDVRRPGHNPIGGYSVLLMLLLLIVQIATGMFAVDVDGIESGQLSHLVDFDLGRLAAEIHEISFTLLQIVAGVHILAILFYLVVRKRNLARPMVTGVDPQIEDARGALVSASPVQVVVCMVIALAIGAWAAAGFPLMAGQ